MKNKILFVLTLLLGLMFINAGLNKFLNYMPMPDNLPEKMLKAINAFNEIGWIMPLVGFAEILGGLLIILPKTRFLGAIVIFPIMIGIVFINIYQDSSGLPIAGVFSAILIYILFNEKEKLMQLLK